MADKPSDKTPKPKPTEAKPAPVDPKASAVVRNIRAGRNKKKGVIDG